MWLSRCICPQCFAGARSRSPGRFGVGGDLKGVSKITPIEGALPAALEQIPSSTLDVVLCISVLEHLWDPLAVPETLFAHRPASRDLFCSMFRRGAERGSWNIQRFASG
jgi:hypothetical protein